MAKVRGRHGWCARRVALCSSEPSTILTSIIIPVDSGGIGPGTVICFHEIEHPICNTRVLKRHDVNREGTPDHARVTVAVSPDVLVF